MNIEINFVIVRKFLSVFDIHVFRFKKTGEIVDALRMCLKRCS
jgi:hypothetical protein